MTNVVALCNDKQAFMATEYRRKSRPGVCAGEWREFMTTAKVDCITCGGVGKDEEIEMRGNKTSYACSICGADNSFVNQCGCDPNNMPTKVPVSLLSHQDIKALLEIEQKIQTTSVIRSGITTALMKKLLIDWRHAAGIKETQ